MASPTTSLSVGFLDSEGQPARATEWDPGFVHLRVPAAQWDRARLTCQGREMPLPLRFSGEPLVLAEWPRSPAGHYKLELRIDSAVFRRVWEIRPKKITSEALDAMLELLQEDLPASLAIALQSAGALAGIRLPPHAETTFSAELLRLRRAVNGTERRAGLEDLLPKIGHDPHQALSPEPVWTKREMARRIDRNSFASSIFASEQLHKQRPTRSSSRTAG